MNEALGREVGGDKGRQDGVDGEVVVGEESGADRAGEVDEGAFRGAVLRVGFEAVEADAGGGDDEFGGERIRRLCGRVGGDVAVGGCRWWLIVPDILLGLPGVVDK